MESGTYLEQEAASPAHLAIQLLMQLLSVALHTLCTHEKHTNEEPREKTLHDAATLGDLVTVELLLRAGKRPSEEDKDRYTPLHWAAAKGHVQVAKRFIEFGAELEKRGGKFLLTPLHMAAGEGHLNTSLLLLDAGAQVNSLDRFRNTPTHWAAWFGRLSVLRCLVDRGGNYSLTNRDGYTPKDMASLRGSQDIIQWFDRLQDVT